MPYSRLRRLVLAVAILVGLVSLGQAGVYYGPTAEETAEYNAPLPDYAQWRAQPLTAPMTPPALVEDYATQVLGHPWDFSNGDPGGLHFDGGITNLKYEQGELSFDVTAPGRLWYGYPGPDRNRPEELKLGANWPTMMYRPTWQMMVKQSLPESKWTFTTLGAQGGYLEPAQTPFPMQGTGWQTVEANGGTSMIHAPFTCAMLEAATPGNHVEIKWIKCGRLQRQGYLRTVLDLPARPRQALFNLDGNEYDLYVNGQPAYSYHYYMGARLVRPVDCTRFLHAGKNTLALVLSAADTPFLPMIWPSMTGTLPTLLVVGPRLQGQVLLADGRAVRVQTDQTWKASATAPAGWMQPGFDDSAWGPAQVMAGANVPAPYDGSIALIAQPAHPSAPSVPRLSGAVPPIFDFSEGARFAVRLPAQKSAPQTEYRVSYRFTDPWTGAEVARGEVQDFHADGPDQVGRLDRKLDKPGAYDLTVQWVSDGQVLDTRHEEILLIGPVPQAMVPEDQVEATLKLKLVDEIDCTDPHDTHPRLTLNGGWTGPPAPFPVQVTTSPAGQYLEAQTSAAGDCVRYEVSLPEPYKWYILEFQYPDDADRNMTFGYEDRYWNYDHAQDWQRADSGPHTGWGLPTTGEMQIWRIPVLPGKTKGSVYIANCKDGNKLAIARLRVYEVTGELPGVTTAHEEPGRNFGIHEERPLEMYSFASFPGWDRWAHDGWSGATPGNYARWYRTYENYIRYLRYAGRNYVQMDLYMYGGGSQPFWPALDKGNDYFNTQFDYVTPLLRMFDQNGINCLLTFEYISDYELYHMGRTDWSDKEVAAGAPTTAQVDKYGRQVSFFSHEEDAVQPAVQQSMVFNLDDLLSRYAQYKSVKGVSFLEGTGWVPGFALDYGTGGRPDDWLGVGYGDYDVNLFTQETGIRVPLDGKDPQRFAQRYAWLKANAYQPWVTWRCQKTKQVNDLLLQHTQAARADLKFAPVFGQFAHFPTLEMDCRLTGKSHRQLLSESGRDPQLYAGQPGYLPYAELYAPDRARQTAMHQQNMEDYGAARSEYLSTDLPALFGSGPGSGLYNFEAFYEQRIALPPDVDWIFQASASPPLALYSMGSADSSRDRFVSSLWHWDPSYLTMVWCDVCQFIGNEENLRRFSLAFRSLPVGKYTLLSGQGTDRNVVIKQLQDRPVWAILNPSPWPVTVELSLSPGATLRDRVSGQSLSRRPGTATVALRAYDLVVTEGPRGAALTGAQATTSAEALSYLQGRMADYHRVLAAAQAHSATVAAADLAGMTAAAAKLDAALQSGDLLTAWLVLDTWEGRRPYLNCQKG